MEIIDLICNRVLWGETESNNMMKGRRCPEKGIADAARGSVASITAFSQSKASRDLAP